MLLRGIAIKGTRGCITVRCHCPPAASGNSLPLGEARGSFAHRTDNVQENMSMGKHSGRPGADFECKTNDGRVRWHTFPWQTYNRKQEKTGTTPHTISKLPAGSVQSPPPARNTPQQLPMAWPKGKHHQHVPTLSDSYPRPADHPISGPTLFLHPLRHYPQAKSPVCKGLGDTARCREVPRLSGSSPEGQRSATPSLSHSSLRMVLN